MWTVHDRLGRMDERGPKDRRVISFENPRELAMKGAMKKDLDGAIRGLSMIIKGEGAKRKADEREKGFVRRTMHQIEEFQQKLLAEKFTEEDLGKTASLVSQIKIGLAEFLSEEQIAQLFGTDNPA